MAYVEHLLRDKLDLHCEYFDRCKAEGDFESVSSTIGIISEIEYVLELLNNDNTYQKY